MARIRTIKPDFWKNEELSEISEPACLLAIGLLNIADDEGYFRANPSLVRAEIFPLREPSVNVPVMLKELSDIGYIRLYNGYDGKQYGHVVNFTIHQKVNKPSASKIKELLIFTEDSVNPTGILQEDSPTERKGKEKEKEEERKGKDIYVSPVFDYWVTVMNHTGAKLDSKRKRLITKAKDAGYSIDDCKLAIDGCKATPWNMGDNPNNTIYDSLDLILRDAEHIDRFIRNAKTPPTPKSQQRLTGNLQAAKSARDLCT